LVTESAMLQPVRDSFRTGTSLQWTRVNDLPDFVYFNHSIHIHKGIACVKCHGHVNEMPLMWREHTLHMQWCLNCHRNPELFVGHRQDVFSVAGDKEVDSEEASKLVEAYGIERKTNCYTCHR
jgi:hypothetical protein